MHVSSTLPITGEAVMVSRLHYCFYDRTESGGY